jgi:hypothetical protein
LRRGSFASLRCVGFPPLHVLNIGTVLIRVNS